MENGKPRVAIHMAASLDGFIARRDGRVRLARDVRQLRGRGHYDRGISRGVSQDGRLLRHGLANLWDGSVAIPNKPRSHACGVR